MKKEISDYMEIVRKRISAKEVDGEFVENLLIRIKFYQHERLIHLIVTMTFAIMTVLSFFMLVTEGGEASVILSILFLCLTVPYVMHYYFLENSVQALYKLYYEAKELCSGR
ncbi:MAG: hypothetical protein IJY73_05470 [Oscillospiraceae bacterium]|nr:hypothetical protein [Oscillospiraceae bacterium]